MQIERGDAVTARSPRDRSRFNKPADVSIDPVRRRMKFLVHFKRYKDILLVYEKV
jgi:hypothetical protein